MDGRRNPLFSFLFFIEEFLDRRLIGRGGSAALVTVTVTALRSPSFFL